MWVRGLKPQVLAGIVHRTGVAPRVGAWIETPWYHPASPSPNVAPRVGAWIETKRDERFSLLAAVAPRVGAWIETTARRKIRRIT